MLGFIFVISPMVLSCSDSEEPGVEHTEHNFVFECTPGSKVQSYRLDVYPLCRMYNYLFESVGKEYKQQRKRWKI